MKSLLSACLAMVATATMAAMKPVLILTLPSPAKAAAPGNEST